jgi:hypothetical protein
MEEIVHGEGFLALIVRLTGLLMKTTHFQKVVGRHHEES